MTYAVVVGGAEGWQEELAELIASGPEPDVYVACNDAGLELEPLDHWASLHPEKLVGKDPDHPERWPWVRQRIEAGRSRDFATWSHGGKPRTNRTLTGWSDGSSGFLALGVALQFADQAVLCGIRMDAHPNQYRPEKQWQRARNYRRGWERRREQLQGRVFSTSGWTRDVFGPPAWALGGSRLTGVLTAPE
jgi:hypothetical protein